MNRRSIDKFKLQRGLLYSGTFIVAVANFIRNDSTEPTPLVAVLFVIGFVMTIAGVLVLISRSEGTWRAISVAMLIFVLLVFANTIRLLFA